MSTIFKVFWYDSTREANPRSTKCVSGWSVHFAVGRPGFHFSSQVIPKDLKNDNDSFPVWRSAQKGLCGEQAGKLASCVFGQDT